MSTILTQEEIPEEGGKKEWNKKVYQIKILPFEPTISVHYLLLFAQLKSLSHLAAILNDPVSISCLQAFMVLQSTLQTTLKTN